MCVCCVRVCVVCVVCVCWCVCLCVLVCVFVLTRTCIPHSQHTLSQFHPVLFRVHLLQVLVLLPQILHMHLMSSDSEVLQQGIMDEHICFGWQEWKRGGAAGYVCVQPIKPNVCMSVQLPSPLHPVPPTSVHNMHVHCALILSMKLKMSTSSTSSIVFTMEWMVMRVPVWPTPALKGGTIGRAHTAGLNKLDRQWTRVKNTLGQKITTSLIKTCILKPLTLTTYMCTRYICSQT